MNYYEDLQSNQYRWSTISNDFGKYTAEIYKLKTSKNWVRFDLYKTITFSKRRLAKAWCLKHVRKAKARQEMVFAGRAQRKQALIDAKPKYSKEDLKFQKAQKNIIRLKANIKRADTKLKTLTTRKHTYEKKIKENQRQIEKLAGLL